jgi:hypothetical protein
MNPFKSTYNLNSKMTSVTLQINHETPLLKITSAKLKSEISNNSFKVFSITRLTYKLETENGNEGEEGNIYTVEDIYFPNKNVIDIIQEIQQIPYDLKYSRLTLDFFCDNQYEIELEIEQKALNLNISPLFKDFKTHFDLKNNSRILFSAPFGKGKTTFLNLYFDEYNKEYEAFHLYPVNYSVASNEDIFKYIKRDRNVNIKVCLTDVNNHL